MRPTGNGLRTILSGPIFDSAYPWTRLGYTYDWADNGQEYGLSEFLIRQGAEVEVAFTMTTEEFIAWLGE